jgi:membrane protein YqaA with SNARE-associated domain
VLHWLTNLGPLGLFCVAAIDSSGIPVLLPGSTDLLLLWLVAHGGNQWLLAVCAVAGSLVGGYTTWSAGSRGGEGALRRWVPVRLLGRIVKWVERHRLLSVFLPALLPPPIPLSPFVLASGALGVSRRRFLVVYGAARSLRYGLVAWLGVVYGRSVVRLWSGIVQKWSVPLICVFVGMLLGGICFAVWQVRRHRKSEAAEDRASEAEAARGD